MNEIIGECYCYNFCEFLRFLALTHGSDSSTRRRLVDDCSDYLKTCNTATRCETLRTVPTVESPWGMLCNPEINYKQVGGWREI